jgi:ABC-2 type transport system permease protein
MRNILNVISFEYLGYLKSKAFIATTIVFAAIILIASMVPQFMGIIDRITSGGDHTKKAIYFLEEDATAPAYEAAINADILGEIAPKFEWERGDIEADADAEAKTRVEDKSYSVAIVYRGGNEYAVYGLGHNFGLYELVPALDAYLTEVTRGFALAAMPAEVQHGIDEIMETTVTGTIIPVSSDGKEGIGAIQNFVLSYILLYVIFMVVVMYGQFVINSVVNEKTTKAMELLITSAKPSHLIFGKVIGVGCVAFTQILIIIIAAAIGIAINLGSWMEQIPEAGAVMQSLVVSPGLIIFFVLFFLTGYFLYSFIYAALGSTVSKIEDASTIVTIPMLILLAGFLISIFSMSNMDAAYVKVLSYIPFFSPFLMFSRLSMGEAGYLQASVAVAILLVTILLVSWLAAKIYRVGVMMYGKPMKLKAIAKVAIGR